MFKLTIVIDVLVRGNNTLCYNSESGVMSRASCRVWSFRALAPFPCLRPSVTPLSLCPCLPDLCMTTLSLAAV